MKATEMDLHNATASMRAPTLGASGWLLLVIAAGTSAIVYAPLVHNHFLSDDFLNLYRIVNCGFWEYLLTPHGGHTLAARNLAFYLSAALFGTNAAGYFWIVLITHVVNVALLFLVVRRLTDSLRIACLGATLWGTCPVHEGALGWYSVYGHVMSATVLLIILCIVTAPHASGRGPSRRALGACYALSLIGTVSFGVGIGIAMALPVVVAWLAPPVRSSTWWRRPLVSLVVVVPALYLGLFWLNGVFFAEGLETPQIVLTYLVKLWAMMIPNTIHLIAYGVLRLLSSFRFDPSWVTPTTSYSVFAALVLATVVAALRASVSTRYAMAACGLLAAACYGSISVGRAAFFDAYTSALMAIQPRYHYTGLVPLTILVCLLLARAGEVRVVRPAMKTIALVGVLGLIAAAYRTSTFRIDNHLETPGQVEEVLKAIKQRADSAPPSQDVYVQNRAFSGFYLIPPPQFPGWAAVFVIYKPSNRIDGRTVYFTDKRLPVLVASARGKRTSGLIVPPPTKDNRGAVAPRRPAAAPGRGGAVPLTPSRVP